MKRFAGKAVLVTGGGSGMGRATAELLAQLGASVCVMGRRADKLDDVVRAICHEGGQALAVQGDTSKPEDVENAVARTVAEFGALHYAVNNTGISGTFLPTADMPLDVWRHTISNQPRRRFLRIEVPDSGNPESRRRGNRERFECLR